MAQSSTKDRKIRNLKRERSIAYRMLDAAMAQRNQARSFAVALEKELQRYIAKFGEFVEEVDPVVEEPIMNSVASQLSGEPVVESN